MDKTNKKPQTKDNKKKKRNILLGVLIPLGVAAIAVPSILIPLKTCKGKDSGNTDDAELTIDWKAALDEMDLKLHPLINVTINAVFEDGAAYNIYLYCANGVVKTVDANNGTIYKKYVNKFWESLYYSQILGKYYYTINSDSGTILPAQFDYIYQTIKTDTTHVYDKANKKYTGKTTIPGEEGPQEIEFEAEFKNNHLVCWKFQTGGKWMKLTYSNYGSTKITDYPTDDKIYKNKFDIPNTPSGVWYSDLGDFNYVKIEQENSIRYFCRFDIDQFKKNNKIEFNGAPSSEGPLNAHIDLTVSQNDKDISQGEEGWDWDTDNKTIHFAPDVLTESPLIIQISHANGYKTDVKGLSIKLTTTD